MTIYSLDVLFSCLEPVCCSMSSPNCYFLTCIQISQEAGQVVWYSHLFKNFPVCCDPRKGFGILNKEEVDVFLELSCFFNDPMDVAIWSLVPLPFLNPAWTSESSQFRYCWSLAGEFWALFDPLRINVDLNAPSGVYTQSPTLNSVSIRLSFISLYRKDHFEPFPSIFKVIIGIV